MISVYCVKIPHSSTIFIWLKQCSFYKYFPHHFAVKLLQLTIILRLIYRQFRTMWLTATCSCLEQWLGWNWLGWNWLKQASGEVREENDWSWTKWALWVAGPYWRGHCEWLEEHWCGVSEIDSPLLNATKNTLCGYSKWKEDLQCLHSMTNYSHIQHACSMCLCRAISHRDVEFWCRYTH